MKKPLLLATTNSKLKYAIMELFKFCVNKSLDFLRRCRGNAYKIILMWKLYIPYLIGVLPVSQKINERFTEVPLTSVYLQGDWVVPGTLSQLQL